MLQPALGRLQRLQSLALPVETLGSGLANDNAPRFAGWGRPIPAKDVQLKNADGSRLETNGHILRDEVSLHSSCCAPVYDACTTAEQRVNLVLKPGIFG